MFNDPLVGLFNGPMCGLFNDPLTGLFNDLLVSLFNDPLAGLFNDPLAGLVHYPLDRLFNDKYYVLFVVYNLALFNDFMFYWLSSFMAHYDLQNIGYIWINKSKRFIDTNRLYFSSYSGITHTRL